MINRARQYIWTRCTGAHTHRTLAHSMRSPASINYDDNYRQTYLGWPPKGLVQVMCVCIFNWMFNCGRTRSGGGAMSEFGRRTRMTIQFIRFYNRVPSWTSFKKKKKNASSSTRPAETIILAVLNALWLSIYLRFVKFHLTYITLYSVLCDDSFLGAPNLYACAYIFH